jgi:ADP-ribosylglycohydrolase
MNAFTSKCHGVLLGQAIGDALGTTVEFADPQEIAGRNPADGWPERIVGKGPFHMKAGQVTDDTELALALARSLVAEGRYDDDAVAKAYVAWLASEPWDHGNATWRAFNPERLPEAGASFSAFIRARADQQTQANGSLMRISPLAVWGHGLPRLELARLAARDSTLSHPSAPCQAACGVFTATIAEALNSSKSGPELAAWAMDFAKSSELTRPVVPWLEAARLTPPPFENAKQGWVRVAFTTAFFHLEHAASFEAALKQVVRAGGDTDTNGAIAGALLGARFGEAGIPQAWRTSVLACVPDRPRPFHCTDLLALADALRCDVSSH